MFESLSDNRLKCRICSDRDETRDVTFKKRSKSSHIRSGQHQRALEAVSSPSVTAPVNSPMLLPMPLDFATLPSISHLDSVLQLPESDQSNPQAELPIPDIFQDVVLNEDSTIYTDHSGNPIYFSTGPSAEESIAKHDIHLNEQITNLALNRNHTIFGQFEGLESLGDADFVEEEPDSIVNQIAAAIEALGESVASFHITSLKDVVCVCQLWKKVKPMGRKMKKTAVRNPLQNHLIGSRMHPKQFVFYYVCFYV